MDDIISQGPGGIKVDLLEPDYNGLSLIDLSATLSRINRFNSATTEPVPITMHSLYVLVFTQHLGGGADAQKWALAHDAHEAMIGDHTRPYHKALLSLLERANCDFDPISALKDRHDAALFKWLNWEPEDESFAIVWRADVMAAAYEVHRHWFYADDIDWRLPERPTELPQIGDDFVDFDDKPMRFQYGMFMTDEFIPDRHRFLWASLMSDHFPHLRRPTNHLCKTAQKRGRDNKEFVRKEFT